MGGGKGEEGVTFLGVERRREGGGGKLELNGFFLCEGPSWKGISYHA